MARTGEIELQFGNERRLFRLNIGQLRAIEERCGAGLPHILAALQPAVMGVLSHMSLGQMIAQGMIGTWRVDYYREVIYQGLVGGGMNPTEAGALVAILVDGPSPIPNVLLAAQIITAWIEGPQEEPVDLGESTAKPETPRTRNRSKTAKRDSPKSMDAAP